jgi:hypothetical protein
MKTTLFSKKVLTFVVAVAASALHITAVSAQQAPVQLAGMAQYKMVRRGSSVTATGSVDQVINNSPFTFSNARVILALSKQAYTPGATIGISTVASASLGPVFLSNTYYTNVSLSGKGRAIKGKKIRVLMLVVDDQSRILGGFTFSKSLKMKALPLTAQALGLENSSEHVLGKIVEVKN